MLRSSNNDDLWYDGLVLEVFLVQAEGVVQRESDDLDLVLARLNVPLVSTMWKAFEFAKDEPVNGDLK